ncbi:MAG: Fe(3+) ABC transporter substrate-binding protein [Rhodospirillales bacterium]|nr:Fe(3+) ABC transporter substrate-binding protein [Rhodospirillales bacterium]
MFLTLSPLIGRRVISSLAAFAFVLMALLSPVHAQQNPGEVNLYSYRQAFLMKPLLSSFTRQTGIKVNAVYAKNGILERLKAEGSNSPADAVLSSDVGRLSDLANAGLLQKVRSAVLEANIPPQYRHPDGLWFGLTTRARVIYAHKTRVKEGEITSYEDLALPRFKGRICSRSGKHPYNITLLASIITAKGEAAAADWARGVKANLARRPQGNDRSQVKAIWQGECDVALGNTYYMGNMATNDKKPEQKKWAASVRIIFPNQKTNATGGSQDRGTHVNASGGAVTTSSKNRENAIRLLEFLSGKEAQAIYAEQNFEYPVKPGVRWHTLVASWGSFRADDHNLNQIAAQRSLAAKIMDRVEFDH